MNNYQSGVYKGNIQVYSDLLPLPEVLTSEVGRQGARSQVFRLRLEHPPWMSRKLPPTPQTNQVSAVFCFEVHVNTWEGNIFFSLSSMGFWLTMDLLDWHKENVWEERCHKEMRRDVGEDTENDVTCTERTACLRRPLNPSHLTFTVLKKKQERRKTNRIRILRTRTHARTHVRTHRD